ncbi:IclR family transcriptional regulator domain-containing protein [Streptomyces sp. SBT349]|uniref:IclR family transcriptional regulator domain-containing protein n=1 Tax=Streptomyces sp. SBT349 TaxID=1580539 RepID=UPI000A4A3110
MVVEGNSARFVDGVQIPRVIRVGPRVGMVLPAHATAAGKAILAALPPEHAADPGGARGITYGTLSEAGGSGTSWDRGCGGGRQRRSSTAPDFYPVPLDVGLTAVPAGAGDAVVSSC